MMNDSPFLYDVEFSGLVGPGENLSKLFIFFDLISDHEDILFRRKLTAITSSCDLLFILLIKNGGLRLFSHLSQYFSVSAVQEYGYQCLWIN